MCPTDDLGIEYDDEVDKVLKDPKSTVLSKTINYMMTRKQVEERLAEQKEKEKIKEDKLFGLF